MRQKNAAWVALGGGVAMVTGGVLLMRSRRDALTSDTEGKKTAITLLLVTGGGSILSSVGLFVASSGNRNYAMSLSLINETAPSLKQGGTYTYQAIPALSFKIGL